MERCQDRQDYGVIEQLVSQAVHNIKVRELEKKYQPKSAGQLCNL